MVEGKQTRYTYEEINNIFYVVLDIVAPQLTFKKDSDNIIKIKHISNDFLFNGTFKVGTLKTYYTDLLDTKQQELTIMQIHIHNPLDYS